ncbi:MAG: hypothetical protein ACJA0B_000821 [Alcanivorax borkumensis]|jgi:hypothetical protein
MMLTLKRFNPALQRTLDNTQRYSDLRKCVALIQSSVGKLAAGVQM